MVYNNYSNAGVLELADEVDSKSIDSDIVRVQVPPPAPNKRPYTRRVCGFLFGICIKGTQNPKRARGVNKTIDYRF